MAKIYRFYNDDKTVDSEYISDGMTDHETFFLTELRSVDSLDIQAGINLDIKGYTETELKALAKVKELNLEIMDDGDQISDLKGGLDVLTYSFPEDFQDSVIDTVAKTIACVVDNGTDKSALTATFTLSEDAEADIADTAQVSAVTENDFSSAVDYTITSEAEKEADYEVSVRDVSVDTDILTFSMAEQTGAATVDSGAHTVAIEVDNGTVVTALVATFTLDSLAIADVSDVLQVSAVTANDYTSPVVYTITAEDGTTEQDWTITVTVAS
jgi:hypothetical protein